MDDCAHREVGAGMPVTRHQLAALVRAVDESVGERGCDGTRAAARAWAERHDVPWQRLGPALEEHGGFCDCEVVLNVDPDVVCAE